MAKIELGESRHFVLASNNEHKVSEIKHMLLGRQIDVISMAEAGIHDDIVEDGKTFYDNALIKAMHVVNNYGKQAIADDSGLEVLALGGEPGVYSARYAGPPRSDERNNNLLLENLKKLGSGADRSARFVSVIAIVWTDAEGKLRKEEFRGEVRGRIIDAPRGDNGFGYDPIFEIDEDELRGTPMEGRGPTTMAELTEEEKNLISHRSRALAALLKSL